MVRSARQTPVTDGTHHRPRGFAPEVRRRRADVRPNGPVLGQPRTTAWECVVYEHLSLAPAGWPCRASHTHLGPPAQRPCGTLEPFGTEVTEEIKRLGCRTAPRVAFSRA